jgi:hypothetical protein
VDQSGNVYVAGEFTGTGGQVDFDPGSGTDKHGTNGSNDAFLSKFDTAGSFLWARNWGGTYDGSDRDELAYNVVVSAAGDAYVAGRFVGSADFDPGAGTDYHSSAGSADAFLIKFLSSGSW